MPKIIEAVLPRVMLWYFWYLESSGVSMVRFDLRPSLVSVSLRMFAIELMSLASGFSYSRSLACLRGDAISTDDSFRLNLF